MKKFLIVLAVLLVVGTPLYWWFLLESGTPTKTFVLELEELRTLANTIPGDKPIELRVEHVSGFEYPEMAVVAGSSWSKTQMPVYAYQLQFADGGTAIIDTAMDEKTAKGESASFFDAAAFTRVQNAIESAQWVIVTHEHFDHLGGAATHPKLDTLAGPVIRLTREQLLDPSKREPFVFTETQVGKLITLSYERIVPIAPGVVVVRMPGHTPGMQVVFVQRADGEEFLFVSDVSWHQENWQQVRERARLVTQLFLGEDRDAVLSQLAAIKALAAKEPKLHVVPGHDGAVMAQLINARLITPAFK